MGLFGHIYTGLGVTEAQSRSSLHLHLILCGGLSPILLEKVCCFKHMSEIVSNALDTICCAQLPKSVHVSVLILKYLPRDQYKNIPHLINRWNMDYKNVKDINNIAEIRATSTSNVHSYYFTYHKPPNGYSGCRLAKPSALTYVTGPVELTPSSIERKILDIHETVGEGDIKYVEN